MEENRGTPEEGKRRLALAVASIVCGLFGFLTGFVTGVPAIICGHLARRRIRESGGKLAGSGMATAGLILGYILSILGGLMMASVWAAIKKQKAFQAKVYMLRLVEALDRYESTYGRLPDPGASDMMLDDQAGRKLLLILQGREEPGPTAINPRQIPFFMTSVSKHKRDGGLTYLPPSNSEIEGFFDTWGNPYRVILDTDGDKVLRFIQREKPQEVRDQRFLILSKGPDGIEGSEDDVKSW